MTNHLTNNKYNNSLKLFTKEITHTLYQTLRSTPERYDTTLIRQHFKGIRTHPTSTPDSNDTSINKQHMKQYTKTIYNRARKHE